MKVVKKRLINNYISDIANGNRHALEQLFLYTEPSMRSIARFYCNNASFVDDVVSDVYLSVVKYADKFNSKLNGYNWMVQIARNLSYKYNRGDRCSVNIDIDTSRHDECDDVDQIINNLILHEAVAVLSTEEKELVRLLYWEGYTPKEVIRMYGMPLSTLYSRIDSIHKKIRDFMDN